MHKYAHNIYGINGNSCFIFTLFKASSTITTAAEIVIANIKISKHILPPINIPILLKTAPSPEPIPSFISFPIRITHNPTVIPKNILIKDILFMQTFMTTLASENMIMLLSDTDFSLISLYV